MPKPDSPNVQANPLLYIKDLQHILAFVSVLKPQIGFLETSNLLFQNIRNLPGKTKCKG